MTFYRSLGLSAGIHLVILAILLVAGLVGTESEQVVETVRIRLKSGTLEGNSPGEISGGDPSGMVRDSRRTTRNAARGDRPVDRGFIEAEPIRAEIPAIEVSPPAGPLASAPPVDEDLSDLPPVDALAGIAETASSADSGGSPSDSPWSVSWLDGGERGIVWFPSIDPQAIPESGERLRGLTVSIVVAPGGDVLSAEVQAPGSGDVRIDRYLHSLALSLVLEARLADQKPQEGVLRLVLAGVPAQ